MEGGLITTVIIAGSILSKRIKSHYTVCVRKRAYRFFRHYLKIWRHFPIFRSPYKPKNVTYKENNKSNSNTDYSEVSNNLFWRSEWCRKYSSIFLLSIFFSYYSTWRLQKFNISRIDFNKSVYFMKSASGNIIVYLKCNLIFISILKCEECYARKIRL